LVKALVLERESLVIEAELVKGGCVEVADVYWVFYDVVGEVVGFAEDRAAFEAAAGHPHGEAARVVVAAVVLV
jgi:hypothetical protein